MGKSKAQRAAEKLAKEQAEASLKADQAAAAPAEQPLTMQAVLEATEQAKVLNDDFETLAALVTEDADSLSEQGFESCAQNMRELVKVARAHRQVALEKNSKDADTSYRIPTPASKPPFAVSPAFGFMFARKGNGTQSLYRIVADPSGAIDEMKELFTGPTRVVLKVMINCLRQINLDGTFRTGKLAEQKPVVPVKKGATA